MKKYKLLATDLDGTLLDDNSAVTADNINAIKKCVNSGIHVVLISGRAPSSIDTYLNQLDLKKDNTYAAGFHGGRVFSTKNMEIVNECGLEKSLAMDILDEIKDIEEIGVLAYVGDKLYTMNTNNEVNEYLRRAFSEVHEVKSFKDIEGEISKVLVHGDMHKLLYVQSRCERFKTRCKIMYTGYNLLEFTNENGNKGDALKHICKILNIDLEETVAIGDNYNDIELIKVAGIGVATYNAVDELKEISDYVTINNNNKSAVAETVEKYFF